MIRYSQDVIRPFLSAAQDNVRFGDGKALHRDRFSRVPRSAIHPTRTPNDELEDDADRTTRVNRGPGACPITVTRSHSPAL
jgi:hypothetical protein